MSKTATPLSIMVSSTVYNIRSLLKQIFATLEQAYGYEVLMSDRSTIPVNPRLHNFENCIHAVETCDIFFGIITPSYGTGIARKDGLSITHLELLRAIELDKPRFMICHQNVVSARVLLNTLEYKGDSLTGPTGRAHLTLRSKSILTDLKTIDMLEASLREDIDFEDRTNHWVQEYEGEEDVFNYIRTNFDPGGHNQKFLNELADEKAKAGNGGDK